jgi:N-acetylneuraminic acid mutarotase
MWLFGGVGLDSKGTYGALNDLWEFSPEARTWTWVSGSSTANAQAVFGTKGVAAASNDPGGRENSLTWIDSSGNLWLFGGESPDSGDLVALNDLWEYRPTAKTWTWVSGSSTGKSKGVYGTQGIGAANNVPGARGGSVSWMDSSGNLWLFGGEGLDSTGYGGDLNDLWEYSPAANRWTWVSGSDAANTYGVYGTEGVAAASNVPGARAGSVSWTDPTGNHWLFGGQGYASVTSGQVGNLNDLWRCQP